LTSEHSIRAEQVLAKDPEWAAPLLWRSQLRNVLALYLRKDLLSLGDAQQIMEAAMDLLRDREFEVTSFHVLELVAASTCSAYDCEYVALAQTLGVPLVTVDRQILSQFPMLAVSPELYAGS
jgi:predicted nucleic acid-binding protein